MEKALVIKEREYGSDHREVAITLTNLGNAYGDLGDAKKQRDLLERALVIEEREYGSDHCEAATTLTNLGNAYDAKLNPQYFVEGMACKTPVSEPILVAPETLYFSS